LAAINHRPVVTKVDLHQPVFFFDLALDVGIYREFPPRLANLPCFLIHTNSPHFSITKMTQSESATNSNTFSEAEPLKPSRIFHIVPHSSLTKTIKVLDITDRITAPYTSDEFTEQAKEIPKSSPPDPWLTVTRVPHWWSRRFTVESASEPGKLVEWKGGLMSWSSNVLSFTSGSPHSSHPITMKTKSYWKFREQFVFDSITYTWVSDNAWTNIKYTLYKSIGSREVRVGRYEQRWKFLRTGGTLVLNTKEIDDVVGVLTCLVVLLKRRQKEAERQNP